MFVPKCLAAAHGKRIRRSRCILYLAPVNFSLREHHELVLRDPAVRADLDTSLRQERGPNLGPSSRRERMEVKGNVNAKSNDVCSSSSTYPYVITYRERNAVSRAYSKSISLYT